MATNMYIKFETPSVQGGSKEPGHAGEIEVLSWSHGFVQPTSPTRSGGGTIEQATHQNLTFTKYLDTATNELLKLCWSGMQLGKATLTAYRSEGRDDQPIRYLEIIMEHVVIANYSISGGPGDVPVENIALDYGIIHYNYTGQKTLGSAPSSATHNLEAGTVA